MEALEDRTLLTGPSAFGHITDGQFDVINGHQEWSDVRPTFFPASNSYLYADQANLNHPPGSPPDTFMLMYDEAGLTTPLGPDQFFSVSFTTVEHEDGHDRLNFYTDHIFADGTITFIENGVVQLDANGNSRVQELGGQRGKVGFGTSPNSSTPHVIAEFQIALSANQTVLNGGYSPDPQFWSSDPPTPPPPPPKKPTAEQRAALNNAADALQEKAIVLALAGSVCTAVAPSVPAKLACIAVFGVPAAADQLLALRLRALARQDPSDPNITVIAQPVVQTVHQQPITASQDITQQEADAVNGLLANEEQALAIEQALSTSINRAQGAFDAGSTFWEDQQQTAVDNYERRLASLVDSEPALLSSLQSAIQGTGLQLNITPSGVSAFQSELAHNGLPPEFAQGFTQALTELGADGATQTDVVNSLIAQDPNAVAALGNGSFPGMLTDPSLTSPLHGVASAFGVVHLGNGAVLPGFDSNILPGNDDGSTGAVPLGFTVNFFGHSYSSVYVNNNGNVTFDSPLSAFTPFDLSSTGRVIVAPFFADVDTRGGNAVTYGTGTVNGHPAFGVTWPGVGYFPQQRDKLNTFQVLLIDRSDTGAGNFDIEFNYDQIQWETGGASGGSDGLGGFSARLGFSNGTGQPGTFFELPGSAVNGAFLDSNAQTGLIHNSVNSPELGQYIFSIRSGAPLVHASAAFLQANLDGTTTVEPTSPVIGQEPTLTEEITRIVQFRVAAGLTNSATQLTNDLVGGLVEDGFISPQQADQITTNVLQSLPVDPPVTVTLQPPAPVEGVPLSNVVVATLRDADPAGSPTDFTATITWGDGSTSTATAADGTIQQNADGSFSIIGSHTYSEEASGLTFSVLVNDRGGASDSRSATIAVADAPLLASGQNVTTVEGAPTGAVTVATFTDTGGAEAVNNYTADINWGDGTPTQVGGGTVSFANGVFTVTGSHTYAEESSPDHTGNGNVYHVTVTIHHEGAPTATANSSASVRDPAVVATGVAVGAKEAIAFTAPVATFTDPGGAEALSDYTADINWGDGTATQVGGGSISFVNGIFTVKGIHTYAEEGTYTITTTINHEGVITVTHSTAAVRDNYGLLVLDPTDPQALKVDGNGSVIVNHSGAVVVDSNDPSAIFLSGHAALQAAETDVAGGLVANGPVTFSGELNHEAATPDPLALPLPPKPSPTFAAQNITSGSVTLPPGTYNGGIAVSGTASVTLSPGVYYMNGGGFSVSGHGSVTGNGVLIVNAPASSSGAISITGQANVSLTASTSLPDGFARYDGIALFQDPSSANTILVTGQPGGTPSLTVTGTVYAPGALLQIAGNGNVVVSAFPPPGPTTVGGVVVVYKAMVVGNGALTINADPPDFPVPAYAGGGVLINYGVSTRDRTLPADGAVVTELASQAPGVAGPATGGATGARPSALAGPTASGPAVPGWSVVAAVPAGLAAEPAPAGAGLVPNGSSVTATPAPAAWAGPVPSAARTPLPAANGRADGGGSDTAPTSPESKEPAEQSDGLPVPAVAPGTALGAADQRPEGGTVALPVWEQTCDAFFTDQDGGATARGAFAEGLSSAPNSAAALAALAVLLGGYRDRRREERGELRRGLLQ